MDKLLAEQELVRCAVVSLIDLEILPSKDVSDSDFDQGCCCVWHALGGQCWNPLSTEA